MTSDAHRARPRPASGRRERETYVYVALPGDVELVTAGRFRWVPPAGATPALGRFVYGRRYRERPDAVELDPVELRLAARVYETGRNVGFFGALRDAMPDYWGRRVLERRTGHEPLDELDYLLLGPDDRAGALAFGPTPQPPADFRGHASSFVGLPKLQAAAEALLATEADETSDALADDPLRVDTETLLLLATSMGGARPKVVVEHEGALYLAKLNRPDDPWNVARVEHALLDLAGLCGLNVARSRLESVAGRDVLLVRRFDRSLTGDGRYQRHRMVSALTLLLADESPLQSSRWSYLLLADELRRVSAAPREDLRELFSRMCFNAAVSNTDDHPRNHAVLAVGRPWRLSPAYDLTPTPMVARDRRDLAMICGSLGRWANRHNLLSEARRFLLSTDEAAALLDTLLATVRGGWVGALYRAGVSESDQARIRSAFLYDGLLYPPELRG
jgi:serine/threonine-protein kinase HipA